MQTTTINATNVNAYGEGLARAAAALGRGRLVIFPTETVYALAASAADPEAIANLRRVKARGDDQPFTLQIAQRADAALYVPKPSPLARRLARKGWPGPLTLICEAPELERGSSSSPGLSGVYQDGMVGLRCPDHSAAERLLREAGVPVAATSANVAGRKPPTDVRAALKGLNGAVEFAVDAGATRYREPSTIVSIRGHAWTIERAGVIEERTIRKMVRSETLFVCTGNSCRSPLAEYLFRDKLSKRLGLSRSEMEAAGYVVSSAGTFGGGLRMSEGSQEQLKRRGMDGTQHRSQPLTVELIQRCERIYTMSAEHREAVLQLAPGAATRVSMLDDQGPVLDPIGGDTETYGRCADHIAKLLDQRIEEFVNEDLAW